MTDNCSSYANIFNLGQNQNPVNNPLTYCLSSELDNGFMHGSGANETSGEYSKNCQTYMAHRCANNWDKYCELASNNNNRTYPNNLGRTKYGLTAGEILIVNTAREKYIVETSGDCARKYEPFDPQVPSSPMVSYWIGNGIHHYSVNAQHIDQDIVMNKILQKPSIAEELLINIYNTMKRYGTLSGLKGTKLGNFYAQNHQYFK